ncbi:hypothetical protein D8B26_004859 [Coccidioides posadasii str. Silveira]|uniref:uncharacterized protein n=1 Tax=Coccidioides posadasii (strain RMSCC 757 / Silveira) TaxID=443226 RepID=UPI001BEDE81D|nr:hypothetical protein D8B26_004859 [Coccidioides posadasii str. Silveira]
MLRRFRSRGPEQKDEATDYTAESIRAAQRVELCDRSESVSNASTAAPSTVSKTTSLSSNPSTSDLEGLSVVYNPPYSTTDIIFVHGLGGSSRRSWSWDHNPEIFWPEWLPHHPGFSYCRIFTFGYKANLTDNRTSQSILDFSINLLSAMQSYGFGGPDGDKLIGTQPIVFVSHSMGGLIVKKAYVVGQQNKNFSQIISKVHGIMFLSTPHKGILYANALNSILAMTGIPRKIYVSELDIMLPSMQDLHVQFLAVCDRLRIVSVVESSATKTGPGKKRIIVDRDSAVLNLPNEIWTPLPADHHTVCKFRDQSDSNFITVTGYLRRLTEGSEIHPEGALMEALGIKQAPEDDLSQYLKQGTPGSCQWFHNRDSFNRWLDNSPGTSTNILWLTGMPGAGKSTLSAMTIGLLHERYFKENCQFYFFIGSQPTKRRVAYCLRSIAFQLARSNREFAARLLRLYRETSLTIENQKFQAIWDTIFEGIIFKMNFAHTLYWVIDAIDEAETSKDFVALLMQMRPRSQIKLLLFSRPLSDLTNLALSRKGDVCLEATSISDVNEDINIYLKAAAPITFPRNPEIQPRVIEQILAKAEGSFLWAKLALETLRRTGHLEHDIRTALDDVPSDMESMYRKMLQQIHNYDIPMLQEVAMAILTWASCSFRPLRVTEFETALRRRFNKKQVSFNESTIELCCHFIRIDKDQVSLIHATARKFLFSSSNGLPPAIDFHVGHESLAIICLDYLCDDKLQPTLESAKGDKPSRTPDMLNVILKAHPFLGYAKDNWAFHLSHSTTQSPQLKGLLTRFFNKYVLTWVHAVAFFNELQTLTRTARYLKAYMRKLRKTGHVSATSIPIPSERDGTVLPLELWTLDLIRLVGKFGSNLIQKPSIIHQLIPPLCPKDSIISEVYNEPKTSAVAVKGVPFRGWGDNLAHLSVGQDETASKVRCAGVFFLTLVSSKGAIIVWYAETFEKLRLLEHGEWVTLMEVNRSRTLLVTTGRYTFKVWDISTGEQIHLLKRDRQARVMCISFGDNDSELLVGYDDCTVAKYDLCTSRVLAEYDVEDRSDRRHSCPRLMAISPDLSKIAVAYRGRPVLIWDLIEDSSQEPKRCIRDKDWERLRTKPQDDVFCAPEIVCWQPNGISLFILYQDNTIVHWYLAEEGSQIEYENTEAREMATSDDGTLLLTSSNTGTLSVWTVSNFNLIYRLYCGPFVRDLTLSPDNQRIYDVRGSICNVWEPDALVRLEEGDQEEGSSLFGGSDVSEPTFSRGTQDTPITTSVAYDCLADYYVCGRDDGTIWLHEMKEGEKIKKLWSHSVMSDVIVLEWSPSRRFLVSADDAGKVILKALGKKDGKWIVFNVFDFRIRELVRQALFSPDESMLLVSTGTMDCIWNIKKKSEVSRIRWQHPSGRRWFNHPSDMGKLIWIDPKEYHVHHWQDLRRVDDVQSPKIDMQQSRFGNISNDTAVQVPSFSSNPSAGVQDNVQKITKTIDGI